MKVNATTAVAGSTITVTFTQPATLIIGFLLYAEYQRDLTIQGTFNLNNAVPAGFAKYLNASYVPCPAGSNPNGAITHSNNNCDYALMVYQYTSDINLPGLYYFRSIVTVDGNYIPDARADWFIITPILVNFTNPAGFTGFPVTATTTATHSAASILSSSQIASIILGVVLSVLCVFI